jgi:putative transposase
MTSPRKRRQSKLEQNNGFGGPDVCRQLAVSEATFYVWKKKYAHLGINEMRRLRQLEDENSRLKRLVADLTLDKHMLSEALRKKP